MVTAQFSDSFPPIVDGVANGVHQHAYWLNRKYGPAYVVAPGFPGYTDREEFEVIRYISVPFLPRKPYRLGLYGISFECRKQLTDIPLEIVHSHSPFDSGAFARQIANSKKIPHVSTFHSQYYYDLKSKIPSETIIQQVLLGIARFYKRIDAVWTVNQSSAETLRDYGFKGRVDVVPNGTDLTMPPDVDKRKQEVNLAYQFTEKDIVFLYVGQMIWHKNIRLIAEGLADVKAAGGKFRMLFVGDGPALPDMKNIVQDLGLSKEIQFAGSIRDRDFLRSIYARANLFLFPSLYDTFGLVVREAAVLGCPSVLVMGVNAAEDIKDRVNGFLCQNNRESFARIVLDTMGNPELLRKVGETARNTLPLSWETIMDQVHGKYQDLIRDYRKNKRTVPGFREKKES